MIPVDDTTVFNPETGEFGYLPEIVQFESDKGILTDVNPVTVTWAVTNATKVLLNDVQVESTGTREFHSFAPIEIVLQAENDLGHALPRTLTIEIDKTPPAISSFWIEQEYAMKGSPIKLIWNVEGHKSLYIDNGIGDVTDTNEKTTTMGDNGVFHLTAESFFGVKSTAEATITVFPAPLLQTLLVRTPDFNHTIKIDGLSGIIPSIDVSVDLKTKYFESKDIEFTRLSDEAARSFSSDDRNRISISDMFDQFSREISVRVFDRIKQTFNL